MNLKEKEWEGWSEIEAISLLCCSKQSKIIYWRVDFKI